MKAFSKHTCSDKRLFSVCNDLTGGFNLLYRQELQVVEALPAHAVFILPGEQLLMATHKVYPTVFLNALST